MILLNKRNTPYVPIIGLFMLIVSAIFFVFPQIFDADFDSIGLDEKIDSRIRYSALALSFGMFLLFVAMFCYIFPTFCYVFAMFCYVLLPRTGWKGLWNPGPTGWKRRRLMAG